jgi:hypothetical protein
VLNGGSGLNIIFSKTLESMGHDMTSLVPIEEAFLEIILRSGTTPVGQVTLPAFGTRENYRMEYIHFKVALFETSYHTILGWPALARFMAIPVAEPPELIRLKCANHHHRGNPS